MDVLKGVIQSKTGMWVVSEEQRRESRGSTGWRKAAPRSPWICPYLHLSAPLEFGTGRSAVPLCSNGRQGFFQKEPHIFACHRIAASVDQLRDGEDAGSLVVGSEAQWAVANFEKEANSDISEKFPFLPYGCRQHALLDQSQMLLFGVDTCGDDFSCLAGLLDGLCFLPLRSLRHRK